MLGSLRLVDPKAAGAQTLRLVTALVVSVAVTGAVTGPLAYRAVEFRSDLARELAVETAPAPSAERAVLNGSATRGDSGVADAASTSAAISPTEARTSSGAATIEVQQAGASTAVEGGAPSPIDASPTSAGENGVSPATASRPPAVTAVGATDQPPSTTTAPPSTPAPGTTTPARVTTTTRNPLDEFNPRPSCDDKAQELNAEDRLACASTSTEG